MWGRRPCTLFCVSPSEIIHNCDREIPEGDLRQETFRTFSGNKKPALERGAVEPFLLCGIMIGFICGFVGAGGGMMLLLILTSVLGYELKTAVGTSVFIMTFTALTGAMSHFAIGGMPDFKILILCVLFTFVGAQVSAKFANKSSEEVLNRVLGIVLCAIGALMIVMNMIA